MNIFRQAYLCFWATLPRTMWISNLISKKSVLWLEDCTDSVNFIRGNEPIQLMPSNGFPVIVGILIDDSSCKVLLRSPRSLIDCATVIRSKPDGPFFPYISVYAPHSFETKNDFLIPSFCNIAIYWSFFLFRKKILNLAPSQQMLSELCNCWAWGFFSVCVREFWQWAKKRRFLLVIRQIHHSASVSEVFMVWE